MTSLTDFGEHFLHNEIGEVGIMIHTVIKK